MTAFLLLIMCYLYALFGFLYVDDTFWRPVIEPAGENVCSTLVQCFTTLVGFGPRSSGSVGDILLRPTYGNEFNLRARFYIRYFLDVSVFFIVNIINMKLLFGIILDTFSGKQGVTRTER
jgi:hypothetical protein